MASKAAVLAAVVALLLVAGIAVLLLQAGGERGGEGEVVVVVETSGLKAMYELVECTSVRHKYVVLAPGGDPHFAQLTPSQARLAKEADIVIVVPGSPAGRSAAELARETGAVLVEITSLDLDWAYIEGNRVYHAPWYDPANTARILEALASAEASVAPSCSDTIEARLEEALERLARLEEFRGALNGSTVVADLPFNVYVARWLGAGEVVLLRLSHEAEPPPSVKQEALEALERGGVALVTVDLDGEPAGPTSEWLAEAAEEAGAKIILVPAPWLPLDPLGALNRVAEQAARLG